MIKSTGSHAGTFLRRPFSVSVNFSSWYKVNVLYTQSVTGRDHYSGRLILSLCVHHS
jgi:hypothetical protein